MSWWSKTWLEHLREVLEKEAAMQVVEVLVGLNRSQEAEEEGLLKVGSGRLKLAQPKYQGSL